MQGRGLLSFGDISARPDHYLQLYLFTNQINIKNRK